MSRVRSRPKRGVDFRQTEPDAGEHPIATVAIPAFNEASCIARAIASARAQTLDDIQILIFDNASTDSTEEICRAMANQDPRVEYHRHPENIGLLPNFNSTFPAVRGRYLRWLGADDWLAPTYLEKCVAALEANPGSVTATCEQAWVNLDTGQETVMRYEGTRITDEDPVRRFSCFMKFMRMHAYYFDPIYSLHRRAALEQTELFPLTISADQILAAEMALVGPFVHLPELLSYRHQEEIPNSETLYPILTNNAEKPRHVSRLIVQQYDAVIARHGLSLAQQLRCKAAIRRLMFARRTEVFFKDIRRFLGSMSGYRALKRKMMRT